MKNLERLKPGDIKHFGYPGLTAIVLGIDEFFYKYNVIDERGTITSIPFDWEYKIVKLQPKKRELLKKAYKLYFEKERCIAEFKREEYKVLNRELSFVLFEIEKIFGHTVFDEDYYDDDSVWEN